MYVVIRTLGQREQDMATQMKKVFTYHIYFKNNSNWQPNREGVIFAPSLEDAMWSVYDCWALADAIITIEQINGL